MNIHHCAKSETKEGTKEERGHHQSELARPSTCCNTIWSWEATGIFLADSNVTSSILRPTNTTKETVQMAGVTLRDAPWTTHSSIELHVSGLHQAYREVAGVCREGWKDTDGVK